MLECRAYALAAYNHHIMHTHRTHDDDEHVFNRRTDTISGPCSGKCALWPGTFVADPFVYSFSERHRNIIIYVPTCVITTVCNIIIIIFSVHFEHRVLDFGEYTEKHIYVHGFYNDAISFQFCLLHTSPGEIPLLVKPFKTFTIICVPIFWSQSLVAIPLLTHLILSFVTPISHRNLQ